MTDCDGYWPEPLEPKDDSEPTDPAWDPDTGSHEEIFEEGTEVESVTIVTDEEVTGAVEHLISWAGGRQWALGNEDEETFE